MFIKIDFLMMHCHNKPTLMSIVGCLEGKIDKN